MEPGTTDGRLWHLGLRLSRKVEFEGIGVGYRDSSSREKVATCCCYCSYAQSVFASTIDAGLPLRRASECRAIGRTGMAHHSKQIVS